MSIREDYIGRPYSVALEHNNIVDVSLPSSMAGSYDGWQDLAMKALVRIAELEAERDARKPWSETAATAYLAERVRLAEHVEQVALQKLKEANARIAALEAEVARLRAAQGE